MPGITLKNIPDPLYQRLVEMARSHHRSLTNEVVVALEHYVHQPARDMTELLGRPRNGDTIPGSCCRPYPKRVLPAAAGSYGTVANSDWDFHHASSTPSRAYAKPIRGCWWRKAEMSLPPHVRQSRSTGGKTSAESMTFTFRRWLKKKFHLAIPLPLNSEYKRFQPFQA